MTGLKILVVGSGGREHALAWSLSRSPQVGQVFVAPGNGGTEWAANPNAKGLQPCAKSKNVPIAAENIVELMAFAQREKIDLTVVGPEVPLSMGIVDQFQAAGLRVFGPTQAAARLEASKAFAKDFMKQHSIPTAEYGVFAEFEVARQFVHDFGRPVVVKADGLAAGKGVIVCDTVEEAEDALRRILIDKEFGAAGETVVIEERLEGEEISNLMFADGKQIVAMPTARDHKRAYDGDQGPNTGGMGAYAYTHVSNEFEIAEENYDRVTRPTIDGLQQAGTPYIGVLYAGLMITPDGPKVLEFNCRFGDPETQVILPLLQTDLVDILNACIDGKLTSNLVYEKYEERTAATVVLAAPGYPGSYPKGLPISGLKNITDENVIVFHAGTTQKDGQLVTNGGRVLNVTAVGSTLDEALQRAYAAIEHIHFDGMHYRKDIGRTGVKQHDR
ncbi:MAG: phosphoribosylamine--glycine ligase [Anaerolineae bacterium]|nr:phosphoribosylamine--glycine ligase [Anaerolineae bacterium]